MVDTAPRFTPKAFDLKDFSPPLDHDRILAAIDVGTNSIHMVVVRIQPSIPAFTIVDKEKDTVRLGDFEKTGNLTDDAIRRGISALKRCKAIASSLQAEDIVAVATSAVREAGNGWEFIQRAEREVGLAINLISGTEEARRIYLGVLSGMELQGQPHAIIDIGGGSTELILGDGQAHRFLSSTKVGAVRLSAQFVHSDPISDQDYTYLCAYVRGMLERPAGELKNHLSSEETLRAIGTSGTIECLAAIAADEALGFIPDPLNGYQMSLAALKKIVDRLRQMSYEQRLSLPEISDRRAEIILAGAIILQESMALLGAESITVCERALREGVVVDWMLSHSLIEDRLQYQGSVRQRSVIKIAHKYRVDMPHSERVAQFALTLFDQLKGQLHNWDFPERQLLWAAAVLHNSGHFVSHSAHHKHSYYLVRNGELLGYTEAEIEIIANLARYHRKSFPKKKHDNYRNLPTKHARQVVEELSPILRLAVALDRRRMGAIAEVICHYDEAAKQLQINLTPANPSDSCEIELWNLDYKKDSFEQEFGVEVVAYLAPNL
ncbi:MAG: Ppx/GppA family phosphatase [Leptolyngbyaceae cyanobacterium SL_1_1]|nr:Ppx/GppA family phosphatase [Leptolyngbyaceae cyanobacterium RM1_1_2]NJO09275.1 Ppx/GppA family phosphatase [Leptolyngbyaceae cyanobacterium SL_1_1]